MKNHHHNGPIHPTSRERIHEALATRAYELWMRDGEPENRAPEFWLAAEKELIAARQNPKSDLALPVSF